VSVVEGKGRKKGGWGERVLLHHLSVTTGVARLPASSSRAERVGASGEKLGVWRGGVEWRRGGWLARLGFYRRATVYGAPGAWEESGDGPQTRLGGGAVPLTRASKG
jgi:hypothetical protein